MLEPGTRLGPYEILSPLGAGGMGEVWKAKDSKLDRLVAIKVLPEHLTSHPEALARFEREAKAVAALSHPNILGIFDLGDLEGTRFAVMELLEGETLRARLSQGPLPPRKAVDLAAQMARGLAAAHGKGIVHRDLKPENLWITKDGRLKILDFGLAKRATLVGSESNSLVATEAIEAHRTEKGVILGTVSYMSPEQVRGEAVDARSDLFSFGVVLYEMLTGQRAFARSTSSDTMAAILRDDPPELSESSGRVLPPGLRRILDHCLEKDPANRFHDAQDLAFALESASGESGSGASKVIPASRSAWTPRLPLVAAAAAGALLAAGLLALRPSAPAAAPVPVRFLTYSGTDTSPAASRDGRTIAFTSARDGTSRIWIKQLRGGGEVALTSGPDDFPRLSPDGTALLFIRGPVGGSGTIYRASPLGTDLHKVADNAAGADWSPDGEHIAFLRFHTEGGSATSILYLIPSRGGTEKELARFPSQFLSSPRWSPDGKAIALTTDQATQGGLLARIVRVDAADGTIREFDPAVKYGPISCVAWCSPDEVIYAQAESVTGNGVGTSPSMAIRQSLRTGVAQRLFWSPVSATIMDLLPDGRPVFDGVWGRQDLREYTLDGKTAPRWITQGNSNDRQPVYSPDGEWVMFSSNRSGNLDLWEVSTKTGVVRSLTDDTAEDWDPGFTPDGQHILWSSNRSGAFEIWLADADGSGARQLSHDGVDAENPTMTRDGRWVTYMSTNPKGSGLWKVHPDGTGAELLVPGTNLLLPDLSPDGQHVVFISATSTLQTTLRVVRTEDGKEVFQTSIAGRRKTVATLGRSRWTPDGRHIVFTDQDAHGLDGIVIQDFVPGQDTRATRRPLAGFNPDWITESLGLSPDGKRVVLSESARTFGLMMAEDVPGLSSARKGGR